MRKLSVEELGRIDPDAYKEVEKIPVVVVVDRIRSLLNVGSIFRTSDAFRVEKVFLCGITACPPHREINKTALGATESVDWEYHESTEDLLRSLKESGYTLVAVEQTEGSMPPSQIAGWGEGPFAVVLGHEVNGVSDEAVDICDHALEIPQMGTKHSLNVSVAAGIILWEFFRLFQPKA
jgi:tRNA G18 (ribose-2'-O)-methylase SpoU